MILIRVDANMKTGSGHVMRCLTVAKELQLLGEKVEFVTADHQADALINKREFKSTCLNTQWNNLEDELSELKRLIREKRSQVVLIDSYYVTKKYLEEIKGLIRVVIFDDLNQFICPVDMIINYNIYASRAFYESNDIMDTKLLLGGEYIPLRKEFTYKRERIHDSVANVLITTGGGDTFNVAGQLIQSISTKQEFKDILFHIVVGPYNNNLVLLKNQIDKKSNVILHQNVVSMSELMSHCDAAISAGGSSLYELCACGTPTVSFSYADNQIPGVKEFDRLNVIKYAGDIRGDTEVCLDNIMFYLDELCKNGLLRNKLSGQMQELVDGYGACRISEEVLILLE